MRVRLALFPLAAALLTPAAFAQEDVEHVPAEERKALGDENKTYFLIGLDRKKAKQKTPAKGYKLLLLLPGGTGSRDFHGFCKRIHDQVLDDDWVTAQLVSKKWRDDQVIIWPTEKNKVSKMKFSTEDFIDAVVEDVEEQVKVDPTCVFTMTWSSSGPAAYAEALKKNTRVTGSFIAMSVFKPDVLPSLKNGKGRAFYIYHSETDAKCPHAMAKDAEAKLKKVRAKVEFADYEGGHRWPRTVYPDMKAGLKWLEKNKGKPGRKPKKRRR